jgi:hypothetical protein
MTVCSRGRPATSTGISRPKFGRMACSVSSIRGSFLDPKHKTPNHQEWQLNDGRRGYTRTKARLPGFYALRGASRKLPAAEYTIFGAYEFTTDRLCHTAPIADIEYTGEFGNRHRGMATRYHGSSAHPSTVPKIYLR